MVRYIFVTGGVCSSLGKWIAASSIGAILKGAGYNVFMQKLDPYLNIDPGTLSPFQHGEVFVTDDGAETDLDLGHYERFINTSLSKRSSVTTGKIYASVLDGERKGIYEGRTIQIVPHITNAIIRNIERAGEESQADFVIVEIGGTVGDIEGEPFLEAIRQMRFQLWREQTLFIHLTLLPYLKASKELKTKPTQLSVRDLKRAGIVPDLLLVRSDYEIASDILEKISLFCNVEKEAVIPAQTLSSIYEVPLAYEKYKISHVISKKMNIQSIQSDVSIWEKYVHCIHTTKQSIIIGIAGKYAGLNDAYLSVIEALKSAGYAHNRNIQLVWIDTEALEKGSTTEFEKLNDCAGVVVPWGFWIRWAEGKIMVATYCREKNLPYFGICLGSQILAIEFARYIGLKEATSQEFSPEGEHQIVVFLPDQFEDIELWGTLRLGKYPCHVKTDTKAYEAYQKQKIFERHRHRYEFNNTYRTLLEEKGVIISGTSPNDTLVEIIELQHHPFMLGTQFHPEFLSRPDSPHPLFSLFIQKSIS